MMQPILMWAMAVLIGLAVWIFLVAQVRRVGWKFPLAWRWELDWLAHQRDVAIENCRIINEVAHKASLRADAAEVTLLHAQKMVAKRLWADDDFRRMVTSLIRIVPQRQTEVMRATKPIVKVGEAVTAEGGQFVTQKLVDFSIRVALAGNVPPEYVAEWFVDEVRAAVLRKWQGQSMLLEK